MPHRFAHRPDCRAVTISAGGTWAAGSVQVSYCWGVTRMKACAATDLALEGRCPGRKFQTKQLVHSGSRICSPKPKSRSSTDAILPSFVVNTYSLAVLGIQSSSSSMNESVLYQTMFPCRSTLISRLLQISRGSAAHCANCRSLSSNSSQCVPVPHAMIAPPSLVESIPQHSSKMKRSFSLPRPEKIPLPEIGFPSDKAHYGSPAPWLHSHAASRACPW